MPYTKDQFGECEIYSTSGQIEHQNNLESSENSEITENYN